MKTFGSPFYKKKKNEKKTEMYRTSQDFKSSQNQEYARLKDNIPSQFYSVL